MRVIEFSHPGVQFKISLRSKKRGIAFDFDKNSNTSGIRYWNDEGGHFRKFLKSKGKYLNNCNSETVESKVQEGDILFWGEFEPPTKFTMLNNPDTRLFPNAVHEPYFNEEMPGIHNTDPYVFGDYFYYSNCKQHRSNMTSLQVGSMILFGTEYTEGFALDTVFIVGKRITALEYLKSKESFSYVLRKATLDKNNLYHSGTSLILYQGRRFNGDVYQDDSTDIFSFFPCKPLNSINNKGFQRPLLDYSAFDLQRPGAGTVLYNIMTDASEEQVVDYWQKIVAEVISQGYSIGIQAEEPLFEPSDIVLESTLTMKGCGTQTKKSIIN